MGERWRYFDHYPVWTVNTYVGRHRLAIDLLGRTPR